MKSYVEEYLDILILDMQENFKDVKGIIFKHRDLMIEVNLIYCMTKLEEDSLIKTRCVNFLGEKWDLRGGGLIYFAFINHTIEADARKYFLNDLI